MKSTTGPLVLYHAAVEAIQQSQNLTLREKEENIDDFWQGIAERLNLPVAQVIAMSDAEINRLQNAETDRRWQKIIAGARERGEIPRA